MEQGLIILRAMCLKALEKLVVPGTEVFDVGTGSGILAIAVAKLGAKKY